MDNLKSTKFIGTMSVIAMSYVLVLVGKLDALDWLNMAVIGVGLYQSANVVQKFKK